MRHRLLMTLAMIAGSQFLQAGQVSIAVTGFGNAIIMDPSATGVTAWDGSTSSFAFYSPAYALANPTAPYPGLPSTVNSVFTSGVTFNLAPITGNDALSNSGTLTLTTPGSFGSLQFLVNSVGASGTTFTATLNFAGGGTDTLTSGTLSDWTFGGGIASGPFGLYNLSNNSYFTPVPVYLHEADFELTPADQAQTLQSITISTTSGNADYLAIAGNQLSATPEPSALTLAGLGAGLLISVRRRRKQ